jgi:hypothetical protein
MSNQDENEFPREGLETARCPTGVGSNPTPRTMNVVMDGPIFIWLPRILFSFYGL